MRAFWKSFFVLYLIVAGITALALLVGIKENSYLVFLAGFAAMFLGIPWSFASLYVGRTFSETFGSHTIESYGFFISIFAPLLINCWIAWYKGWGTQDTAPQADTDSTQSGPSGDTRRSRLPPRWDTDSAQSSPPRNGIGFHLRRFSVVILVPGAFLLSYNYWLDLGKAGGLGRLPSVFYEMALLNCWLFFVSRPTLLLSSIVPVLLAITISYLNLKIHHYAISVPGLGALVDALFSVRGKLLWLLRFSWTWEVWSWFATIIGAYVMGYIYVSRFSRRTRAALRRFYSTIFKRSPS